MPFLRAALAVVCACALLLADSSGVAAQPPQQRSCLSKDTKCGISAIACCPPLRCVGDTPVSSVCMK